MNSEATPWCSAFANYVNGMLGLPVTQSLRARSWSDVSATSAYAVDEITDLDNLTQGDMVVLWRESRSSSKGHIAYFASRRNGYLYLLGGNQSNRVCVKGYPEYRFEHGVRFAEK